MTNKKETIETPHLDKLLARDPKIQGVHSLIEREYVDHSLIKRKHLVVPKYTFGHALIVADRAARILGTCDFGSADSAHIATITCSAALLHNAGDLETPCRGGGWYEKGRKFAEENLRRLGFSPEETEKIAQIVGSDRYHWNLNRDQNPEREIVLDARTTLISQISEYAPLMEEAVNCGIYEPNCLPGLSQVPEFALMDLKDEVDRLEERWFYTREAGVIDKEIGEEFRAVSVYPDPPEQLRNFGSTSAIKQAKRFLYNVDEERLKCERAGRTPGPMIDRAILNLVQRHFESWVAQKKRSLNPKF